MKCLALKEKNGAFSVSWSCDNMYMITTKCTMPDCVSYLS